jgi:glycine/serine hydroxymethyltransferase
MKDETIELIKKYTRHKHARLTERCNTAIFIALCIAKEANRKAFFLIPDQGGWTSYRTYPSLLGIEAKEVKTNYGIIDIEDLRKKAKTGCALIISSFAGYFAEQPVEEIAKVCHENNCLLIEDASGAIGDETLCNGSHSDIIVGSFGRWKPVNVGYGGFISTNNHEYFEKATVPFSMSKVHEKASKEILGKLKKATERIKFFMDKAEKAKKDLENYNILHKSKRGLNVAVMYDTDKEKEEIAEYCRKNRLEYVDCPKYERVMEKAVSIEIKRL